MHATIAPALLSATALIAPTAAQDSDIVDALVADGDFTILVSAVQAAGLVDALKGPGPLTVFAPTDEAFSKVPPAALNRVLSDRAALTDLLLYHVVAGELLSGDVAAAGSATALNGDPVLLGVSAQGAFVNDSVITAVDWKATNGVIHTIDTVLTPGQIVPPSLDIVDALLVAPNFEVLAQAVRVAGLAGALKGPGPITLFAPTDAAFAALPEGVLNALVQDPDALADVLLYHAVGVAVTSQQLPRVASARTLSGQDIWINQTPFGASVNQAELVVTDIQVANGVIHVIDAVLTTPAPTIPDFLAATGVLPTLLTAVDAAGLVETLAGPGPFTIFAPTERAFGNLPEGTLDALLLDTQALADILTYHVVPGRVLASDVIELRGAKTVQGEFVAFSPSPRGPLFVNQSQIVFADIQLPNGVIHLIDAVLLPPADGGQ